MSGTAKPGAHPHSLGQGLTSPASRARMVAELNPGLAEPRVYPGSPRIAAALARPGDRLLLAELHPEEAFLLRGEMRANKAAAVHERDGYEMLKALTPPPEKRGLVLMDPPYEKADEFELAAAALKAAA